MNLNELSYLVRGILFKVHATLGPGLLESIYQAALLYEFSKAEIHVVSQVPIPVIYHDVHLELGFRIDILVENLIILEIKSVECLHDVHKKQLLTYLKLADKKLGFLVNFNSTSLIDKESLIRIIN